MATDGLAPEDAAETPARSPAAEAGRASEVGTAARGPIRRPRSNLPWVLSAVFGVVVLLVLWVAVAGLPSWPSGLPGGSGSGGGPPPTATGTTTVLSNGTAWSIGAGHFEATWFSTDGTAQVLGSLHSTVSVRFWIEPSWNYPNWSGTNSTYGTNPSPGSAAESASNWSSGPGTAATFQAVVLGPGAYDLIVEDTNSSVGASVTVTQAVVLSPFDTN